MSIGIIFSYLLIAFFTGVCLFLLNMVADGFFMLLGLLDRELQDRHMKKLHEKWKKENLNKLNSQFKNAA